MIVKWTDGYTVSDDKGEYVYQTMVEVIRKVKHTEVSLDLSGVDPIGHIYMNYLADALSTLGIRRLT